MGGTPCHHDQSKVVGIKMKYRRYRRMTWLWNLCGGCLNMLMLWLPWTPLLKSTFYLSSKTDLALSRNSETFEIMNLQPPLKVVGDKNQIHHNLLHAWDEMILQALWHKSYDFQSKRLVWFWHWFSTCYFACRRGIWFSNLLNFIKCHFGQSFAFNSKKNDIY